MSAIMTEPTEPTISGGYWITSWQDADGQRHRKRFGNAKTVSESLARRRFKNWLAQWRQTPSMQTPGRFQQHTISTLTVQYLEHAEVYYRRKDGSSTGEAANMADALETLEEVAGEKIAAEFAPSDLQACQQAMVQAGLARTTINSRINRIRRFFKWLTVNGHVKGLLADLAAVPPLAAGRSQAREPEPVTAVHDTIVEATFAAMVPTVRDMVDLQHLAGMRSGELVIMRWGDIDVSGKLWVYRPAQHKTEHLGKKREIFLGPRCQEILNRHRALDTQAYIFSPQTVLLEHRERRRAGVDARKLNPARLARGFKDRDVSTRYTAKTYRRAIERACEQAFPPPEELLAAERAVLKWKRRRGEAPAMAVQEQAAAARQWRKDHRWTPHQLRHACATRLRKEYGLEQARIILGHSSMETTEIYAEIDREEAKRIMLEMG